MSCPRKTQWLWPAKEPKPVDPESIVLTNRPARLSKIDDTIKSTIWYRFRFETLSCYKLNTVHQTKVDAYCKRPTHSGKEQNKGVGGGPRALNFFPSSPTLLCIFIVVNNIHFSPLPEFRAMIQTMLTRHCEWETFCCFSIYLVVISE